MGVGDWRPGDRLRESDYFVMTVSTAARRHHVRLLWRDTMRSRFPDAEADKAATLALYTHRLLSCGLERAAARYEVPGPNDWLTEVRALFIQRDLEAELAEKARLLDESLDMRSHKESTWRRGKSPGSYGRR